MTNKTKPLCAIEASMQLIGGKYKAVIIWHIMRNNVLRYSEIRKRIPHATDKMLAQQLRELEADGLLHKTIYPVVPPKTEYRLTEFGQSLAQILNLLDNWGEVYLKERYN
ncbi:helix-turn-helix domain-containing protein [Streptococcus merionis]|uniref:winged helix-turn-helix transcriptional regulator n=1 Tax=Streptococcus merionis TaxID=400065 RepID=UPI0026EDDB07|nr:helix-turn-helix domain-containing protein [Streptococcus merionis]